MNRQFVNADRQGNRIPKVGFIIAAFMLILAILIILHSRSKDAVSPLEILLGTPQGLSSDVKVFSQDGVTVYMPPGATELDGTISIATAQPDLSLVADDTSWIIPKVVKVEFLSLEGAPIRDISFSEPLEICFDFTEEQWQGYSQNPEAYQVRYYAAEKSLPGWETLPLVTHPDRSQVCGQTYRLSLFGLSIQAEAGIPVTGFTTSMPPAAVLPSIQTSERREGNNSNNSGVSQVIPTNPPPTNIPPTQPPAQVVPTNPPPTQPPALPPQPVDPPPAAPPVVEPPAPAEPPANENNNKEENKDKQEEKKDEKQDEKDAKQDDKDKDKKDKKQPGPSG